MSDVSIQIKGIDELIRKLGRAEGVKHLRPPMQRSVYRLQGRVAQYPSQRPNSTYRRTGTLGRKWTGKVEQTSTSVTGKVGNNASYAPLVQSYQFQARIHRGLWQTDRYVMETEYRTIIRDFEDTIKNTLK